MGVYLEGVEMPKDYAVVLKIFPDGKVGTVPYIHWFQIDRIEGAQAIPVSEPHGRLGDLDELFRTMESKGWFDNADRDIAEDIVLNAHTIIQASEEVDT